MPSSTLLKLVTQLVMQKIKLGTLSFIPFCHYTWRGITVPPDLFVSGLGNQFLSACIACSAQT